MQSLQQEVAEAIADGFASSGITVRIERPTDYTALIYVGDNPPIKLYPEIEIPPSLKETAAGIRLDIQAIMAERPKPSRRRVRWLYEGEAR